MPALEFDLETILTTSRYAAIIVPLLLVGAFSLAVYRAGSAFPILASLWQLTAGKRTIGDNTIARYVQAQHDLASFKFFSHIQTASVAEAARLIAWTERHRIPMRKVKACGRHFNIDQLSIDAASLPSRAWRIRWGVLIAATLTCATASLSTVMFMKNTYASFKDDGQRFVLTSEGIRTLDGRFQIWNRSTGLLDETSCKSVAPQTAPADLSLTPRQTQILCEALGSAELTRLQKEGLRSQQFAMALLAALFYWGMWLGCSRVSHAQTAERLMKQLTSPAQSTPPRSHAPEPQPAATDTPF